MNLEIIEAVEELTVRRCAPVMRELRPQYDEEALVQRVLMQLTQGFRLVGAVAVGEIRAVAGFRILENLAWGRFLYVDDLVSCEADRGAGHGSALIDWLVAEARRLGCDQFHLDSGVQRFGAHRFYLHKGMDINCHHFAMTL
ncbi:MAG: GNAT family N-acetyltransferase [Verrucomicrobiales bacterium]|nr:GNAT family N-acetyltransferase [Verrucomicrobiales bacterium]MCP5558631.1 GNAT family N-acetyltransferase [Verrucomicrobiaceae bacterium]